jgi:tetratricopeptide (TPR) repeat protein
MKELVPPDPAVREWGSQRSGWPWLLAAACLAVILIALLLRREENRSSRQPASAASPGALDAADSGSGAQTRAWRRRLSSDPAPTAAEIVADKLSEFARNRREVVRAMARRFQVEVPADVERFFAAVEGGRWDEIENAFKPLHDRCYNAKPPPHDLDVLWGPILESLGAAESAHEWPAQKLLDYGNAVLGTLRPGMVYVGGTDPGRFIPTLLNETSDGERHVIVTQNGLAAGSYLDYVNFLYGDRLAIPTDEDSNRAFQDYLTDFQQRLAHDQQFPDEPKQVLPGENSGTKRDGTSNFTVSSQDERTRVSGEVAVMAVNERLLQMVLEKNPNASFALEESFPLKSTYAGAAPLGPIMELRVPEEQNAFTAERAAQTVDYWRTATQQLLSDTEATGSPDTLKTYSHMAAAQANLLADHNYNGEAEEAYRLASQVWPGNPEAANGLAEILARAGRAEDARGVLEDFVRNNPDQRPAMESAAAWRLVIAPPTARPASQP